MPDETSEGHPYNRAWQQAGETGVNPKDLIGATKVPFQVVPWAGVAYMAFCMYDGGVKYAPVNWRDIAVKLSIYAEAGLGHFASILDGKDFDPITGLMHAGYAMSCGAIIIDAKTNGSLIDDRFAVRRKRSGAFTRDPDKYPEAWPGAIKEMLSKPLRLDPVGSAPPQNNTPDTPLIVRDPPRERETKPEPKGEILSDGYQPEPEVQQPPHEPVDFWRDQPGEHAPHGRFHFVPKTEHEAASYCMLMNLLEEAKTTHPTDSVHQLRYIAAHINGP